MTTQIGCNFCGEESVEAIMFFVKVLLFLLFHVALPNNVWYVYVEFELYKVMELQYGKTSMMSAIFQTDKADISCPFIVQHTSLKRQDTEEAKIIHFPCAFINCVVPVTHVAQPKRLWIIT